MITEQEPKVSVIMPVYNADKYLEEAIESIMGQTFPAFELLLIDDGSTDRSGAICDAYALKDERVRVFHKKNGGICSARNKGLQEAKGEYIAFCDNDDKYLPDLLKDNYALAKEYDADVVRFKRMHFYYVDGRKKTDPYSPYSFCVLRGEEIGQRFIELLCPGVGVWNGLYRRMVITKRHIRFPEFMKYGGEDRHFNDSIYRYSKCVVMNPKVYYYWIQRDVQSTSHKFEADFISSDFVNMKRRWELLKKLHVAESRKDCFFEVARGHLMYVYRYINRKNCPYSWLQKAGILRQVCLRIPDKELLKCAPKKEKMKKAMLRNDGISLMRQLGREDMLEW